MSCARSTRRIGLAVSLALVVPVGVMAPAPALVASPTLEQKVVASDSAAYDYFGSDVAVDGATMVVGAAFTAGYLGAVYVFERSGDTWTQVARLTASDGAVDDYLGASVAIDGDVIVAGAPGDDSYRGAVYVFARTGTTAWSETGKLTVSDGAGGDWLGVSVAVDGDVIVAGGDGDEAGQGAVYTFDRTGAGTRSETGKLTSSDGATSDNLGRSVAIDGDTIVAGAPLYGDGADSNRGAVYTFARTGDESRTETAKLIASDGVAGDFLGASVALEGDTIVAGAPDGDPDYPTISEGAVYIFARTGDVARSESGKLTASDGAANDALGASVAIDGDVIVAGAADDSRRGSVYIFARTGDVARTESGRLTASDGAVGDSLGGSVAIDGATVAAGAGSDDVGANQDQGSVVVFFAPAPVPSAPDTTAPDTTGLKGPKKVVKGKVAKFRFASSEPGSSFRCKVDKKRWKDCTTPYKVKTSRLKVGKHTLWVVAIDAAGNVDPSPAKKKFRVLPR